MRWDWRGTICGRRWKQVVGGGHVNSGGRCSYNRMCTTCRLWDESLHSTASPPSQQHSTRSSTCAGCRSCPPPHTPYESHTLHSLPRTDGLIRVRNFPVNYQCYAPPQWAKRVLACNFAIQLHECSLSPPLGTLPQPIHVDVMPISVHKPHITAYLLQTAKDQSFTNCGAFATMQFSR